MSDAITSEVRYGHRACTHGRCPRCDGCGDCDQAEAARARKAIIGHLVGAAANISQALASIDSVHVAFTELTRGYLFDIDLAETCAGDDAVERLAQVMADLRDVARIIENRQLCEQLEAHGD